MKRISTLVLASLTSLLALAADSRPRAIVSVTSYDRGSIRVVLDGRRFESGGNTISINDVEAGFHSLSVYRERVAGPFNVFGRRYEMIYSTSLSVRPKTQVNLSIDRFGRTSVTESRLFGGDRSGRYDRDDDQFGDRDGRYGRDDDYNGDRDRDDHHADRDDRYGRWENNRGNYDRSLSDREFDRVIESIRCEWLESNKLKSATQVVSANLVSAAQVKQLMKLFAMESNKLELAKRAYQNTVDKDHYFIVSDELCFNSSKDELARFIRSCR